MLPRWAPFLLLLPLTAVSAEIPFIRGVSNFDPDIKEAVTDTVWYTAFTTPNATGSISFPGRDTRKPYPGTPSEPWKYTIKIRDDVPRTDGGFTTGAWLQLEVPQTLTRENTSILETPFTKPLSITDRGIPQHESWEICQQIFLGPGLVHDATASGTTCQAPAMEGCLGDLKRWLESNFGNQGIVSLSNCPLPSPRRVPESCRSFLNVNGSLGWGVGFDGTATFDRDKPRPPSAALPNGTFSLMMFGSGLDNHQAGDRTFYEVAVRRAYVVGHVWGYKRGFGDNTTAPSAEAFCLEASDQNSKKQVGNGSASGGNDPAGGTEKKSGAKGNIVHSALFSAPAVLVALLWTTL